MNEQNQVVGPDSPRPKIVLSLVMQIAKIAFWVLVITQTAPILLLGMGAFNQIAVALFPANRSVMLPVLLCCEALVLAGMVALVVWRVRKAKKRG